MIQELDITFVMQAIYHGKPMIAMPVFADQPYTANRIVGKV
jgi:UDP:flavonoid glycosyltransferase YjiC (YdhE family)